MNEYVKTVCKFGQGASCCKYLVMGKDGFKCMKSSPVNKEHIDSVWNETKISQGDNCEGREELK